MVRAPKPSLRFLHSTELRKRTEAVLLRIEQDRDPSKHAAELSSVVCELTTAGLDYYCLGPLVHIRELTGSSGGATRSRTRG